MKQLDPDPLFRRIEEVMASGHELLTKELAGEALEEHQRWWLDYRAQIAEFRVDSAPNCTRRPR